MAIRIDDDFRSVEVHGRIAAIARLRQHAAAGGHGARIVSCLPVGRSAWNQMITTLTVTGLRPARHVVSDRLVGTLRQELW